MVRRWRVKGLIGLLLLTLGCPAVWAEDVTVLVMIENGTEGMPGAMTLNARGVFYKTATMEGLVHIPWEAIRQWQWNAALPRLRITWAKAAAERGKDAPAQEPQVSMRIMEQPEQAVSVFRQYARDKETRAE